MTPETQRDCDFYKLTDAERRSLRDILDDVIMDGGAMYAKDKFGDTVIKNELPVVAHYRPIRGRRFLLDPAGRVWPFRPKGGDKDRRRPGEGAPARFKAVEMWTGGWRETIGPDGEATYAKRTIWVSLEENTNTPEGSSPIEWNKAQRGYKHPLDPPAAPTDHQLAVMTRSREATQGVVYAQMGKLAKEHLGLSDQEAEKFVKDVAKSDPALAAAKKAAKKQKKAKKRASRPKRSNKSNRRADQDAPAVPVGVAEGEGADPEGA